MSTPDHRTITVVAPGRVNLIGDHTDYTGGLVLPMAIDRYTTIRGVRTPDSVRLVSRDEPAPVDLPLDVNEPNLVDPHLVEPQWGRYVAGVVAELAPTTGFEGEVSTTLPIGAGLSSSAALEIAVALALGFDGPAVELAELCQRAEQRASGVPCGIMDQLTIAAAVEQHAVMIDCHDRSITPVALPEGIDIVVRFIAHRTLVGSPYADRVNECAVAEAEIGPLRLADVAAAAAVTDPTARRRALHVVGENQRVRDFAAALAVGDLDTAGALMVQSHDSLRDLYDTSTPVMDRAVRELLDIRGVFGARMTGGGFGGCVVALCQHGALTDGWVVQPVGAAAITTD